MKAREIEPEHVDAALAEIEMTAKNPYEEEMLLCELQQKAEKQLREQGDFLQGDRWRFLAHCRNAPVYAGLSCVCGNLAGESQDAPCR